MATITDDRTLTETEEWKAAVAAARRKRDENYHRVSIEQLLAVALPHLRPLIEAPLQARIAELEQAVAARRTECDAPFDPTARTVRRGGGMMADYGYAQWFDPPHRCRECGKPAGRLMSNTNGLIAYLCERHAKAAIHKAHQRGQFMPDQVIADATLSARREGSG